MLGYDTSREAPAPLERPGARTQEDKAPMSDAKYQALYKRHKTREPGITYRLRADGSRVYYVLVNGKQVAAGDSFEQAKARKSELGVAKAKGERIILPSKITLSQVAEEWWEQAGPGLKDGTRRDYRSYLDKIILPKLGSRKLSDLRPADILSLVREGHAEGVSDSTIANRLKPLRSIMEYAVTEKEALASSPFTRIGKGKLPSCNATREHREWSTEDVRRLVAVAHQRDERPEARTDYGLAIETKVRLGLRLGELLGLQYGDIGDGVLSVRRQWTKYGKLDTPKTKKSLRRVPLPNDLALAIKKRKLAHGCSDSDFVFAEKGHNPPQHSNWRRRGWYPACEAAGLDGDIRVTPHDARHAFASQMAALGLTSSDVAETLGHTTAGVTERIYTHAFDRDRREERVRQAMSQAANG